jgi:hypothetical protein
MCYNVKNAYCRNIKGIVPSIDAKKLTSIWEFFISSVLVELLNGATYMVASSGTFWAFTQEMCY